LITTQKIVSRFKNEILVRREALEREVQNVCLLQDRSITNLYQEVKQVLISDNINE